MWRARGRRGLGRRRRTIELGQGIIFFSFLFFCGENVFLELSVWSSITKNRYGIYHSPLLGVCGPGLKPVPCPDTPIGPKVNRRLEYSTVNSCVIEVDELRPPPCQPRHAPVWEEHHGLAVSPHSTQRVNVLSARSDIKDDVGANLIAHSSINRVDRSRSLPEEGRTGKTRWCTDTRMENSNATRERDKVPQDLGSGLRVQVGATPTSRSVPMTEDRFSLLLCFFLSLARAKSISCLLISWVNGLVWLRL